MISNRTAVTLVSTLLFFALFTLALGLHIGRESVQREALRAGAARYVVDPVTQDPKFEWIGGAK